MVYLSRWASGVFATAALTMLLPPAHADGSAIFKFTGEKDWTATCVIKKENGKEHEISRRGRGFQSSKSLSIRNIASGECTVVVPADTRLTITFTGRGSLQCPFERKEPCEAVFSEEGEHTFHF